MDRKGILLLLAMLAIQLPSTRGNLELGKFSSKLIPGKEATFVKSLYENSEIKMRIRREGPCTPSDAILTLKWVIRSTSCYMEYDDVSEHANELVKEPYGTLLNAEEGEYLINGGSGEDVDCGNETWPLQEFSEWKNFPDNKSTNTSEISRKRRENGPYENMYVVAKVPTDSRYLLIVKLEGAENFSYTVYVDMQTPKGYLSVVDYPLLPFYGICVCVYTLFTLVWLLKLLCNLRNTSRVHYLISTVLVFILIQQVLFCYACNHVNKYGVHISKTSHILLVVFYALKCTSIRMLLLTLSMGFAISRTNQYKAVFLAGVLYCVLYLINGILLDTNEVVTNIAIEVLDLIVLFWICINLLRAIKLFKLRKNTEQLSKYKKFSIILGICLFAFFALIIKFAFDDKCLPDWKGMWFEDHAIYEMIEFVIMTTILILWRPTAKDHTVSFSRLSNEEGGDEDQILFDNEDIGSSRDLSRSRATNNETSEALLKSDEEPAVMDVN